MTARPAQIRKPWADMTASEKNEAALPLLRSGKSFGAVAELIGAPSRNAIATVAGRLVRAGKLPAATRQGRKASRPKSTNVPNRAHETRGDVTGAVVTAGKADKPYCAVPPLSGGPVNSPSSPSTSSRSETPAGAAEPPPSSVPALLSVKDSRSNKKVRGGKPNTNRIAAVRSKSEASLDRHIARRMNARIETPKVDPGLPITITKAAAFDPLPGVEPVALVDIPAFGRCRWPVEPDAPGHFMCGSPCEATAKYCCAHKQLSISPYQPQTRKAAA